MAATRSDLERYLSIYVNHNTRLREQASELLGYLKRLHTNRSNIQHLLGQAEQSGGIARIEPILKNRLDQLWQDNARIRAAFKQVAFRYLPLFPGLTTDISTIPEDFSQWKNDPRL